jgi:hypothetical protein
MQREPEQWFWALEAMTGENPVPRESAGLVSEMAQAWIERGQVTGPDNGMIASNAVNDREPPPHELCHTGLQLHRPGYDKY